MTLKAFDHVNIQTTNLDEMVDWYSDILGLSPGDRPGFSFPGAWLYLGSTAVVHLVGVEKQPDPSGKASLEHFAFAAEDMTGFIAKLEAHGIPHTIDPVPDFPIVQVNLHDPDGNHIHVDFDTRGEP